MADEPMVRGFGPMLAGLEDGQLHTDLSNGMADLMVKVQRQAETAGKARGKLVLELKLEADQFGVVTIDGVIKVTEPKPARQRSVRWLNEQGQLVSENPKQQKLPLRDVGGGAQAPKDVPEKKGERKG
jgi:hypothetical protein